MLQIRYTQTFKKPLELPLDDYAFHMLLTLGRVVSKPSGPLYVEATDGSATDTSECLVFRMSLIDATTVASQWPEFSTTGLVGQWRLSSTTGLLKLVKAFEKRHDSEAVKAFLKDAQSSDFMRQRYTALLQ